MVATKRIDDIVIVISRCHRWTFNLYDLNGDGVITKEEMENVTASVKITRKHYKLYD